MLTPADLQTLAARLRSRPVDVVCVGHAAWDETWHVDELPRGGGKLRATDYRLGGGGMAATAAVAVARLGGRAHFWGRAGDDLPGHAMRDELRAFGVDVDAMRLFEGARSSVSGIVVDAAGERSIVNFRGAGLPEEAAWLPLDLARRAGALLADPRWPEGALLALRAAREAGVATVLDGDVADRTVFDALLPWVDCAVFSEPGLAGYVPDEARTEARLARALAQGCRLAAVTRGEHGVWWTDGGALRHQAAFAVPVVDTTGAGDAFHGAFALALAAGLGIDAAMQLSAAVAALKCTRPGGRDGIPDLDAVHASIDRLKEL